MPIPGVTVEDVDAYSDVSNGSTISVGSAASGGSGHMPRPPTGGSGRTKSVQGRRSTVAKSPYSSSQLKVSSKQQFPKPTARNMWISAMKNGTATLSTENSPMRTVAGSRALYTKNSKTGTRQRHLSDFVTTDNLKNKNHVRSASMSASEPQVAGGGPAYKPQEDYYDEIIELKKVINALKAENNVINTKLRRVEGENVLKDRKMEDLLNQRKQPEDVRRTLTDKKGDTSAIVNSLKQKLHAVERTVKDKEAELSQLRKDIKMTNIEELQIQSETYYQEVQRLQLAILEMQQLQGYDSTGKTSPRNSTAPRDPKRPSSLTLKRLAEENDHLKAENRSLKKDLLVAIENSTGSNRKVPLKAEYADMNRGQLLAKIHELEEKVQDSDEKKTLLRKGSLRDDKEEDGEVRRTSISKLAEVPGRIQLKGSTSHKLAQLQEREGELLEERQKQREVIERLKEDRAHYRSVADALRLQLKSTQEELDILLNDKAAGGQKRRSSTSSTSLRRLSIKESRPLDDNDDDMDRMLREFQQQRAAKTLQRQWRGFQGKKQRVRQEEENRQNQAAATLQKNWRKHRDRNRQMEAKAKEEAITEIQAALRGQAARCQFIEQLDKGLEMTDRDDAIVAIQSAMRAHLARKKHLGEPGDELVSRDSRTRGSSSHALVGSEQLAGDGLVTKSTSSRRHPEPAIAGPRRSSLSGSRRLISAPRFSNISEQSEDEGTSLKSSKSNRNRFDEPSKVRSAHREFEQRPKKKSFEIVDSDDDEDDDDDDDDDDDVVVVPRSRRALDTGHINQQRPSLSPSRRTISPPAVSEEKTRPGLSRSTYGISSLEERVLTTEGRPGLSRASGKLAAFRNVENSEPVSDENLQRPSRLSSKRPLSAKRSNSDRNDSPGEGGENQRTTGWGKFNPPAESEGDSDDDDDVVVVGRKTKAASRGEKTGRPSLTRKSHGSSLQAPPPRETLSSSLDNFFSSTAPTAAHSNSKKSPRKTPTRVDENEDDVDDDDDNDDDDDDDDDIVISSRSKYKSRKKEAARKDSRDSVTDLWATSEKRSNSSKGKSSAKSSKRNTWSSDFEFEKPPRRPESQLDELF